MKLLARGSRVNRQGMNGVRQIVSQNVVNEAVTFEAAEPREAIARQSQMKMRSTFGLGGGVSGVAVALVHEFDRGGRECSNQFGNQGVTRRHTAGIRSLSCFRKCVRDGKHEKPE